MLKLNLAGLLNFQVMPWEVVLISILHTLPLLLGKVQVWHCGKSASPLRDQCPVVGRYSHLQLQKKPKTSQYLSPPESHFSERVNGTGVLAFWLRFKENGWIWTNWNHRSSHWRLLTPPICSAEAQNRKFCVFKQNFLRLCELSLAWQAWTTFAPHLCCCCFAALKTRKDSL